MTHKVRWVVAVMTVVGALLGGLAGYLKPELMGSLGFIGGLFVNGLRLIVVPLIIAGLVAGVASIGQVRRTGSALGAGLLYFLGTTVVAIVIAFVLVNLVNPGAGVEQSAGFVPQQISRIGEVTAGDVLARFIPTSQVSAVLNGNYFGLILFSLAFGLVLSTLGAQQRVIVDFFRGLRDAMIKLVPYLLYAAPVGLFFLVGQAVAGADVSGSVAFAQLGKYLMVVFGALLIQGVIVIPLVLKFFCNRSPIEYFGNFLPAFGTALGTGSSLATIPVTYECVVDKARVDNRASALMIPLGATINLDGSAITGVVVAMFVAQVFGIDLSLVQTLLILGATLLVSIGTAGLPGASLLTAAMVFNIAGFPAEAYAGLGLVVAADWLVDRGRAVVNVWSDATAAAFVDQRMKTAALASSRSLTRPQRSVTRDTRDGYRREDLRGRDRRTGGGRYDRERGQRQGEDRRRNGSRDGHQGRDRQNQGRERTSPAPQAAQQNRRQDQPSPFAMPTNSRSSFDQDASKPVPEKTPEREPRGSSRSTGGFRSERSTTTSTTSTTNGQNAGRKRVSGDRPKPSGPRRSTESSVDKRVRRPRPVAQSDSVEKVTPPTPAVPSNELNQKTIERERERVSAQLAGLRLSERQARLASREATKDRPEEPSKPAAVEPIGEAFPHIDYSATDVPKKSADKPPAAIEKVQPSAVSVVTETPHEETSRKRPTEAPAEAVATAIADDSPGSSEQSFGRKKVRKGEKFKAADAKPEAASPEPSKPEPSSSVEAKQPDSGEYDVEKQSFGRAKKKRTRR